MSKIANTRLSQASTFDRLVRDGVIDLSPRQGEEKVASGITGTGIARLIASGDPEVHEVLKQAGILSTIGAKASNMASRVGARLGGVRAGKEGLEFSKNVSKPAAAIGAKLRQAGHWGAQNAEAVGAGIAGVGTGAAMATGAAARKRNQNS